MNPLMNGFAVRPTIVALGGLAIHVGACLNVDVSSQMSPVIAHSGVKCHLTLGSAG